MECISYLKLIILIVIALDKDICYQHSGIPTLFTCSLYHIAWLLSNCNYELIDTVM